MAEKLRTIALMATKECFLSFLNEKCLSRIDTHLLQNKEIQYSLNEKKKFSFISDVTSSLLHVIWCGQTSASSIPLQAEQI